MSYERKIKLLIGKQSKHTHFGKFGSSKGMYTGGHNYWIYGIKGLLAITKYEAWGGMIRNNPNLK